ILLKNSAMNFLFLRAKIDQNELNNRANRPLHDFSKVDESLAETYLTQTREFVPFVKKKIETLLAKK
ncbi:hypothetical protein KKA08_07900, partial [bacterium]|nr:hypothetical protein [bacterium]